MTTLRTALNPAINAVALWLRPQQLRWNALETRPRRHIVIGALVLVAGFIVAFAWLPAQRSRDALTARLPQLEAQLATMRVQAKEVAVLAATPAVPAATRSAADAAALQSIFGPGAQIVSAADGFRVVIPAIDYANWWDRTGEALSRHALVLREATLTHNDGPANTATGVAVDMRLAVDSGAAPVRQGK
jgi:hypothetical protein